MQLLPLWLLSWSQCLYPLPPVPLILPQNSCVEILNSKDGGIMKRGLWEVLKSYGWSSHEWD